MSKRRGVKVYGGQPVNAGGIIIRQLGTKVRARAWMQPGSPAEVLVCWRCQQLLPELPCWRRG